MRKKLLLIFGLTTAFVSNLNAQNQFDEKKHLDINRMQSVPVSDISNEKSAAINADRSYYYYENNAQ